MIHPTNKKERILNARKRQRPKVYPDEKLEKSEARLILNKLKDQETQDELLIAEYTGGTVP